MSKNSGVSSIPDVKNVKPIKESTRRDTMQKHTKRVIEILKKVLVDLTEIEKKTGMKRADDDVIAYTSKTTTPNIYRHDVEMMIAELECECTHPNGAFTECFAPENCCPDQLVTYLNDNDTRFTINCQNTCVHHLKHKKE